MVDALLHPKFLGSFSRIPFPETINANARLPSCAKELGAERAIMKSNVAKHHSRERARHCGLLQTDGVKRIEIVFLCKKYELLLRALRSNNNVVTTLSYGDSPRG